MKNNITDLRNHLFAQLERLNDEDLTQDKLEFEKSRAESMVQVAESIIESAKVEVLFAKFTGESTNNKFLTPDQKQLPNS